MFEVRAGSSIFDAIQSVRGYDPVARKFYTEELTEWIDNAGNRRTVEEFIPRDSGIYNWHFSLDAQKNLYASSETYPNDYWNATFQRFARFTPSAEETVAQPEPDPSVTGKTFTDANSIVLQATPFKDPDGYKATGSRWQIFPKGAAEGAPLYDKQQTGSENTHKLPVGTVEPGSYEWQMSYDWEYSSSAETIRSSTQWSTPSSFTYRPSMPAPNPVVPDPEPDQKSAGGCSASGFGLGLGVLALAGLTRKNKRYSQSI